jgi:NitT/TauT family transport system permease protein
VAAPSRPSGIAAPPADRRSRRATAALAPQPASALAVATALASGAIAWELASRLFQLPFLPSLDAIARAIARMAESGEIAGSLGGTIGVLALGYGAAVIAGVPIGLLLGRHRLLAYVFDPYLDALLAVPSVLLVPIFFGLFGLSRTTQVASVFVYSFAVIVVMTRSGLATLDRSYVEMARAFGASERQIFHRVLVPGALPTIMAGLRLGIGRAVRGTINAEMLIGSFGLGALIRTYGGRFDAASVYGLLAVLVALALAANQAMHLLDRRLTRWSPELSFGGPRRTIRP